MTKEQFIELFEEELRLAKSLEEIFASSKNYVEASYYHTKADVYDSVLRVLKDDDFANKYYAFVLEAKARREALENGTK